MGFFVHQCLKHFSFVSELIFSLSRGSQILVCDDLHSFLNFTVSFPFRFDSSYGTNWSQSLMLKRYLNITINNHCCIEIIENIPSSSSCEKKLRRFFQIFLIITKEWLCPLLTDIYSGAHIHFHIKVTLGLHELHTPFSGYL